jgi:hypothetical protein
MVSSPLIGKVSRANENRPDDMPVLIKILIWPVFIPDADEKVINLADLVASLTH